MQKKSKTILDRNKPVAVWKSKDLLNERIVPSLTIILRTEGCRWKCCTMCGYAKEGVAVTDNELLNQFSNAMQRFSGEELVKIYTSGSFLDPREVPNEVSDEILETLGDLGVKRLVIETRPEYVESECVQRILSFIETEFSIGLETSNDLIRDELIKKGFSFQDFIHASKLIHERGGRVKAYLLLKPPLLTEGQAITDAICSAQRARPYADILSLNLCNVQRGTLLERIWERGGYRPPWLWSAVEVLKSIEGPIICDPVGAGAKRGPHNCGQCDAAVAEAIRKHSLTQNAAIFENLSCHCMAGWKKILELEKQVFGVQLAEFFPRIL
ncbi:MAG: archaeosine biosynthesis radical SAM protein RaSEA [Methanotrichaceae archaeon]|nr:archaeosine biosynthesis radical SAM protein RaSEA [Methanotrichaceae archaeon]